MNDLLDNPEGFYNHVRRYTASVASILTYGQRGPTFESFWAHGVYDVMDRVRICILSPLTKISYLFSDSVDWSYGSWCQSPCR